MSMNPKIELSYEQVDDIIRQTLDELILSEGNDVIVKAMHYVRAYFSVPGKYAGGIYDLESQINPYED